MQLKSITLPIMAAVVAVSLFMFATLAFTAPLKGDVDLDGQVEPGDYRLAVAHVIYGVPLSENMIAACDMTGDGKCSRADLRLIAQEAGVPAKVFKGKK